MVTYNHEKYIKDAILSIYNQDYKDNFNFIISDDCSSDTTKEIIKKLIPKCPHNIDLNCFYQSKNLGSVANFNFLLSKVKSGYIVIADGDDISSSNRLSYAKEHLLTTPVDLLISNALIIDSQNQSNNILKYHPNFKFNHKNCSFKDMYTPLTPIFGASYIFNCNLVTQYGLIDEDFVTYNNVDQNFFWRAFLENGISYTGEVLLKYRVHTQSKSLLNSVKSVNYTPGYLEFLNKIKTINEISNLIYMIHIIKNNLQKAEAFSLVQDKIKTKILNLYEIIKQEKIHEKALFRYYTYNTILFQGKYYKLEINELRKIHSINYIKVTYKIIFNKNISHDFLCYLKDLFDRKKINKKDILIICLLKSNKILNNPIQTKNLLYNTLACIFKIKFYKINLKGLE